MRLLCATGEKHTYAETQISLSCEGYEFKTKGKTVVQNGWKAIEELFKASLKAKEKDDPVKSLPEVHEGDVLESVSASVTEHFTTPPKQYTEDTLLSAMETAGNDQFDDDTEKKGLGTPATRAGIIEKLVKSGFAERKGKSLIPTKDGCNLVCVLPEQITSPAMTAEWENTLMEIERGKADADAFLSGIVRMTGDLVKAYPFLRCRSPAFRHGQGGNRQMSPLRLSGLRRQGQLLLLEQGMLLLPVGRQQVLFQQEKEADQEDCKGAAGQGLVPRDRALHAEEASALRCGDPAG